MSAAYYAKGMEIWKSPVTTDNGDGTKSISIGFQCATATEIVGEEGAQAIAEMLTLTADSAGLTAEAAARIAALEAEFDQMVMECFEVVSTTDVDQNGNHIERSVPKHHLLAADVARLEAENERLRKALETTPPATNVAVPSVDNIAEVLFSQRGTPYSWERAIDADPLSDEGTLVSIVRDDARAVLALFAALEGKP